MKRWIAAITGGVIIVVACAAALWVRWLPRVPELEPPPDRRPIARLATSEVGRILAQDFRIVFQVGEVPASVRRSFERVTGHSFDLVNPKEPFAATDVHGPDEPTRRLILAGLRPDSAVLLYEQGGIAYHLSAIVLRLGENGAGCAATLKAGSISDLAGLREAFQKGRYPPQLTEGDLECPM